MTQVQYDRAEHEIQPAAPDNPADRAGDDDLEAALRATAGDQPWSSGHPVNLRLTVPVPLVGRWYLTVVAGKERRSRARLTAERRKHPLRTLGNVAFAFAFGSVIGLALLTLVQLAIVAIAERSGTLPETI